MQLFVIINFLLFGCMILIQADNKGLSDELKELWKGYEKHGFTHDIGHLKEEANHLIYMQETEQISLDTAAFYYTKLHDFNNDGGLDGTELLLAVKHQLSHSDSSYENVNLEQLSEFVDTELEAMDLNNNGIADYGEIYTFIQKARAKIYH